jgi:hypothetical protein
MPFTKSLRLSYIDCSKNTANIIFMETKYIKNKNLLKTIILFQYIKCDKIESQDFFEDI